MTMNKFHSSHLAMHLPLIFTLLMNLTGCANKSEFQLATNTGDAANPSKEVASRKPSPIAIKFVDELVSQGYVNNVDRTVWIATFDGEWGGLDAWVGVFDGDIFTTMKIVNEYDPQALHVVSSTSYDMSLERWNAIASYFAIPPGFVSGRDYPASSHSDETFAGKGYGFSRSIVPDPYDEINQISGWIEYSMLPYTSTDCRNPFCDPVVPLELMIPWVISRYYSPARSAWPNNVEHD